MFFRAIGGMNQNLETLGAKGTSAPCTPSCRSL